MANVLSPVGFTPYRSSGYTPTYELTAMPVLKTNTTAIFKGDPVIQATNTTGLGTGYITQASTSVPTSTITSGSLSAGVMTLTIPTISPVPAVGSIAVIVGATSTEGTINGAWTITAATSTSIAFNFPGAFTTGSAGTIYFFTPIAGIFAGCSYLSTARKNTVWSDYFPGSDANSDVTSYIYTDPNMVFSVQTANSNTTATAVGLANIGQNIGFNYLNSGGSQTNGTTQNGLSTMFADQYTLAANYGAGYPGQPYMPFKIVGIPNYGISAGASILPTINGNDTTTAYNNVLVQFNQAMFRAATPGI